MALPALATEADVEARLGRSLDATETARVTALLADASSAVRDYTHQVITLVEDDTAGIVPQGAWLTLPQRPVIEDPTHTITTTIDGAPVTGWKRIRDRLWLAGGWNLFANSLLAVERFTLPIFAVEPVEVQVTYSHGYADTPDDVVAVVCGAVIRALTSPGAGVTSEQIGGYSYRTASAAGAIGLLKEEQAILDRYRRRVSMVMMR